MKNIVFQHKVEYTDQSSPALTVISTPNIALSSVSIWFKAGSRYSPHEKEGLPHLFEHLFISHNSKYKTKANYAIEMEKKGLLRNAYTSKTLMEYHFQCLPGKEVLALNELIKSYSTFELTQEDLIKEIKVIKNEEFRNKINPSTYIHRIIPKALWPNSEASSDLFGTASSLENVTLNDIRQYHKRYLTIGNMYVLITSPIKIDIEKCVKLLNVLKKQGNLKQATLSNTKIKENIINKRLHIEQSGKSLNVCLAYRFGNLSEKELLSILLIKTILSDGWSSKLNYRLRLNEGITYWVKADFEDYIDSACFKIYFSVDKSNLNKAIKIIKEEVEKVKTGQLSTQELMTAKKLFQIDSCKKMNNLNYLLQMYGYSNVKWGKKIKTYNDYIDGTLKLNAKDISEASKKLLLNSQLSVITLGTL